MAGHGSIAGARSSCASFFRSSKFWTAFLLALSEAAIAPITSKATMIIPQIPLRLSCFINQKRKAMRGIAKIKRKNQLAPVMPQMSEEIRGRANGFGGAGENNLSILQKTIWIAEGISLNLAP